MNEARHREYDSMYVKFYGRHNLVLVEKQGLAVEALVNFLKSELILSMECEFQEYRHLPELVLKHKRYVYFTLLLYVCLI